MQAPKKEASKALESPTKAPRKALKALKRPPPSEALHSNEALPNTTRHKTHCTQRPGGGGVVGISQMFWDFRAWGFLYIQALGNWASRKFKEGSV